MFPDGPTYRFFRLYGLNNWGCHGSLCNQMIIEEWEMFGPPTGACCFPTGECLTETPETCTAAGGTYVGDDVPCEPDPCEPTPVNRATWGCLKSKFAPSDR